MNRRRFLWYIGGCACTLAIAGCASVWNEKKEVIVSKSKRPCPPKEVGACGNHCAGCQDFLVLMKNDNAFCRQVAANLTKEVGREVLPEQVGCEGCWGNIHTALAASLQCKIRQCCDDRGFATCADCANFPCPAYLKQFPAGSHQANNIRAIKEHGLDNWIAQQTNSAYRPAGRAQADSCRST